MGCLTTTPPFYHPKDGPGIRKCVLGLRDSDFGLGGSRLLASTSAIRWLRHSMLDGGILQVYIRWGKMFPIHKP